MKALPLGGARVAVLGASGFIGAWVCRAAARGGASVIAVARNAGTALEALRGLDVIEADLAIAGAGAELLERVRPHCVVNAVGYGVDREERDAALTLRLNVLLVEELGHALAGLEQRLPSWPGRRLVHLGSAFEYGSVAGHVPEDTPCHPATPYGQSKLEGTQRLSYLRTERGLRSVTLRVATVYGPGEHPHRLLPSLIRASRTGETLSLTAGEQQRDFTYVEDVAEGVVRVAASVGPTDPVVNLATGKLQTVRSFAACARDMLGIPPERVVFGALPYRDDEVWQGEIDVSRLQALLGWRPATGIEDGVSRTIASARPTESERG